MLKKSVIVTLILMAISANVSFGANPMMTLDLQVTGVTGATMIDPKTVIPNGVGDTVNLAVYGTISGCNDPSSVIMRDIAFRLTSNQLDSNLQGIYSDGLYCSVFFPIGSNGAATTYTDFGNVGPGWGGDYPAKYTSNYMISTCPSGLYSSRFLLGTITWTVTSDNAQGIPPYGLETLQVVPYINCTNGRGYFNFEADGTTYANGSVASYLASGVPVYCYLVPEPSTLILLGMGVLSLLAISMRRTRK